MKVLFLCVYLFLFELRNSLQDVITHFHLVLQCDIQESLNSLVDMSRNYLQNPFLRTNIFFVRTLISKVIFSCAKNVPIPLRSVLRN